MNKDMLLGGGVVLIIAVVAWFVLSSSSTPVAETDAIADKAAMKVDSPVAPAPKKQASAPAIPKSDNTFPKLFNQEGSHKCTYESVANTGKTQNLIYIANGKMRGEFRTTIIDKTTSNLMVYDGSYLYSWQEGMPAGVRSRLTSVSELPVAIPKDLTSGAVLGEGLNSVSWDCHPWITDASLLKAPSYVKFQ